MNAYYLLFFIPFFNVVECGTFDYFGKNTFKSSLEKIHSTINFEKIIDQLNSTSTTWTADVKSILQIPLKFLTRLLGEVDLKEDILPLLELDEYKDVNRIPDEFDARKHWPKCPTIRQIRDQGVCGSCWAVSTSSAFSDRACIAGLTDSPLSEGQVLSCCADCGRGCDGGNSQLAWNYFISVGLPTGGLYNTLQGCQPYEIETCEHNSSVKGQLTVCSDLPDVSTPECQKRCTNSGYQIPYEEDFHKVETAYILRKNATQIQQEIMTHGPVVAAMTVYTDFYAYKTGIYQKVAGDKLGSHAVRLLGWGSEKGLDYWLVANSWNPGWGEGGTFRIKRGSNECGIENKVTAGLPANKRKGSSGIGKYLNLGYIKSKLMSF